jgi:choline dehydrogenase-like flavoprotein
MLPTSRGSVTLTSTDPADSPAIDPNYYATEFDRVLLRTGIRQVVKLMLDTPDGQSFVASETPPPGFEPLGINASDAEIDARVRRAANTFYHAGGSASMGSVVDTELKVYGIDGLRVVDASVLPLPICAHYQVPVYALAEQAADIIKNAS